LYKSCSTPAADQAPLVTIHEQKKSQPMTASRCSTCPPSHCDVINWLLRWQT